MNIIAIMGPHGVYHKDEPIKELEAALQRQGFQTIWPQNSADLLRKDVELKLRIFVAGVLFDDGTVEKSLTAADFDEIGCAKVYFIYPPETKTSICHNLSAYQDGEYMGLRR